MKPILIIAIIAITQALIFYSIGVIGEARRKNLMWSDIRWFGAGLLCDAVGTFLMNRMSATGDKLLAPWAGTLMAISGTLAILLMAIHIVFAVVVMKRHESYRTKFHKWSVAIWVIWLVSYVVGPIGLMAG